MKNIIMPLTYGVNVGSRPLIFVGGPLSGAPLWYGQAIDIIHSYDKRICVACPDASLDFSYLKRAFKGVFKGNETSVSWQRHYFEEASRKGAIMFWLPNEVRHFRHYPYARDTRGELGEWRGHLYHDKRINIVIGAEDEFPGLDTIKENFLAVQPDMEFPSTLEETCLYAAQLACHAAPRD